MIQTIISGIGLGLGIAIMLGPAFFALLQTSIDKGFRNAVRFAIGITVSDAFLIAIVFLGVASLLGRPYIKDIVGLVGGGILIGIGIHTFLQHFKGNNIVKVESEIKEVNKIQKQILLPKLHNPVVFYVKGFLLNLANPAVWFFWIFWVGVITTQYTNATGKVNVFLLIVFFLCTLGTILFTDVLKAFLARQLKKQLNNKLMAKVNITFGLILIGFGVYLVVKSTYPIFEIMLKYYQLK